MASTQPRKIFVNLPVRDLKKSMRFFSTLGFDFNKQFTNENGACMVHQRRRIRDAARRAIFQDLHHASHLRYE